MDHQEVGVAGELPDGLQNGPGGFDVVGHLAVGAGVGMDKDGAVVVLFRGLYVGLGHVHQVEAALGGAHLIPLGVVPVQGVDSSDGLHGEEHH